jgi:hypothetical protein
LFGCLGDRDSFYVYVKRGVSKYRLIVGYIGRYLRRPAIVESCISGFNVETNVVIFWFVDEHKVKRFVVLYAFLFIGRLVRLIADKNLKLFWYYGLCSRCITGKFQKVLTSLSREKVLVKLKRKVICCSNCGYAMDLVGVTRPDEGGGLIYDEWDDDYDYAGW